MSDDKKLSESTVLESISPNNVESEDKGKSASLKENLQVEQEVKAPIYLSGIRFYAIVVSLILCLFLNNLETSVVSTALNTMTDDLNGFSESAWVVNGFLIAFVAFLSISSVMSSIFGMKLFMLLSLVIFTAFSIACGVAQNMGELIVFRIFQGLGAGSLSSLAFLVVYALVPRSKLAPYAAIGSLTMTTSAAVAPVIGGALTDGASWRWVYFIMVPFAVVTLLLIFVSMPADYPKNETTSLLKRSDGPSFNQAISQIDGPGILFLLCSVVFLIIGLYKGSSLTASWSSSSTIGLLVAAAVTWILFNLWERRVSQRENTRIQPLFPWRFYFHRQWLCLLLLSFVIGIPFNFLVVNWPQRFQLLEDLSPLQAGVRLLPYIITSAFSSVIFNVLCAQTKISFFAILLGSSLCNLAGLSLLAGLYSANSSLTGQYIALALSGIGTGGSGGTIMLALPFVIEEQDIASATGASLQFRELGGVAGLAASAAILSSFLKSRLQDVISPVALSMLLQNTATLDALTPEQRMVATNALSDAYSLQYKVMCGAAAVQVLLPFLLLKRGKQYSYS